MGEFRKTRWALPGEILSNGFILNFRFKIASMLDTSIFLLAIANVVEKTSGRLMKKNIKNYFQGVLTLLADDVKNWLLL